MPDHMQSPSGHAGAGIHALQQQQGIHVHAFLLEGAADDGLVLLDTLFSEDAQIILDAIQTLGKTPTDLKHIVLTHAHRAHMGGLARLKELSGAKVYCHEWEADIVSGDRLIQQATLLPKRPYLTWPGQIAARFLRHTPCPVDQILVEGDHVGSLQVVAAPGHTPGHLAFFWPERHALFPGDALVNYPNFAEGWAGFMLNPRQNWASLHKLAELDIDYIGVGHGDPVVSDGLALLRRLISQ
jgi:glyoxylase-like metal-dependent hydrolase (beta-lactamase superfamily II)